MAFDGVLRREAPGSDLIPLVSPKLQQAGAYYIFLLWPLLLIVNTLRCQEAKFMTVRREASGSDLFPLVSQSSNRRVSITYFHLEFFENAQKKPVLMVQKGMRK